MSRENTLSTVLKNLSNNEEEIRAVLPDDLPYERFIATTQQALLQFPAILDCTPASVTQACMKAAYDGLRIDGKEAAIVERKQSQKGRNQGQKKKLAHYMPMAFGLVQQIYRGKEVIAMEVEVVYESDQFHYQKGTDPLIQHVPDLKRPKDDQIIAAYSIATLKTGVKTFEVLDMADLAQIRAAASTDMVWKQWPGEMSKKSAVRRHRKMLPLGDRDIIIDSEQSDMYGMDAPGIGHNSQPAQIPPRPRQRAAIENQQGTGAGMQMLSEDEPEGVTIDAGQDQRLRNDTSNEAANLKRSDADVASNEAEKMNMPEDDDGWRKWCGWFSDQVKGCKTEKDLDALMSEHQSFIAHCPDNIYVGAGETVDNKRTDFAMEAADGA